MAFGLNKYKYTRLLKLFDKRSLSLRAIGMVPRDDDDKEFRGLRNAVSLCCMGRRGDPVIQFTREGMTTRRHIGGTCCESMLRAFSSSLWRRPLQASRVVSRDGFTDKEPVGVAAVTKENL